MATSARLCLILAMISEEPLDANKNIVDYGQAASPCGLATAALVMGIVAVLLPPALFLVCVFGGVTVDPGRLLGKAILALCLATPPVAMIIGVVAMRRLRRLEMHGTGVAGVVRASVGLILAVAAWAIYSLFISNFLIAEWRFG